MSRDTLEPQDFAERLERSFGAEPGHAGVEQDLARGRRALRRQRALAGSGALAVAATVAAAVVAVPALLPGSGASTPVASGARSDAAVVRDCLANDHVLAGGPEQPEMLRDEVLATMGRPRLMTRADTGVTTVATVRSEDGAAWLDCTLSDRDPDAVKAFVTLYPTAVRFPRADLGGVRGYQPHSESDPRLEGTATGPAPGFAVTCDIEEQEETAAYARAEARCPTYTLTWNDRRPAEVAAALVVAPDGTELHPDVRDGYVSLAWTGRMTPQIAEQVARGEQPDVRRVVFYDAAGRVLVDDRDPGHWPTRKHPGTENFPSLAWWLRD